jgi:hypothetical protein
MTLTINIAPDLQSQLYREATLVGLDPGAFVARLIEERLRNEKRRAPRLSARETELLREINHGLSPSDWQRYRDLIAQRRAEALSPAEQNALIALSDEIEAINVRRIECLVELAHLRNTSLETLMAQLGIKAPAYA